jgi:hypothetical protein
MNDEFEKLEEGGSGLFQDTVLELSRRDRATPPKTSASMVSVSAEIRTDYLQNASKKITVSASRFVYILLLHCSSEPIAVAVRSRVRAAFSR